MVFYQYHVDMQNPVPMESYVKRKVIDALHSQIEKEMGVHIFSGQSIFATKRILDSLQFTHTKKIKVKRGDKSVWEENTTVVDVRKDSEKELHGRDILKAT